MAHNEWWYVASALAVRTFIVFVFLIVGLRLLGKRNLGQMQVYDLAMIMAVANGVQNAMTNGSGVLAGGLASAGTLLISGWALNRFFTKLPRLESRWVGHPTLLVNNGHLVKDHMRRERVSTDMLMAAVRAHGLRELSQVKMAILEVDGSLSIVEAQDDPPETEPVPSV